jgi:hypothetical protein
MENIKINIFGKEFDAASIELNEKGEPVRWGYDDGRVEGKGGLWFRGKSNQTGYAWFMTKTYWEVRREVQKQLEKLKDENLKSFFNNPEHALHSYYSFQKERMKKCTLQ